MITIRAGVALAMAVALAATPAQARRRASDPPLTPAEELELGRAIAERFESATGESDVDAARRALESVVAALPPPPGPSASWELRVLRAADPGAFALPGPVIVVTQGLVASEPACRQAAAVSHAAAHALHGDPGRMLHAAFGASRLRDMAAGRDAAGLTALAANLESGGVLGWHGRGAEREALAASAPILRALGCDEDAWQRWLAEPRAEKQRFLRGHPRRRR